MAGETSRIGGSQPPFQKRPGGARVGKQLIGPTPAAERWLVERPWNGNVRELRNVIERACILADGEFITERELTGGGSRGAAARALVGAESLPAGASDDDRSLSVLERERIREVLERTGGNKVTAARILGLSRRALYRRLERYGLEAEAPHKHPKA